MIIEKRMGKVFGNQAPEIVDPCERGFVDKIYQLIDEKRKCSIQHSPGR